jgi:hypothetical protein
MPIWLTSWGKGYIPLEPGEQISYVYWRSTQRELPVVEQRYEYNPDVEYNGQTQTA